VATITRGTVMSGEGSGPWPAGVEDMRPKENIKKDYGIFTPHCPRKPDSGGEFVRVKGTRGAGK
jgi:hypothetical protein